jgi:GntR family transcriptional regulator
VSPNCAVPAEQARLRCPPGTAAFSLNRLGYAQDRPMEWRHTLVRGDRFALTAEFAAHTGCRLTQPATAHAHT